LTLGLIPPGLIPLGLIPLGLIPSLGGLAMAGTVNRSRCE
jgi:hypothetical protein